MVAEIIILYIWIYNIVFGFITVVFVVLLCNHIWDYVGSIIVCVSGFIIVYIWVYNRLYLCL